ncbi:MAG: SRPBCC family protein [Burkholderiales bacterium]
MAAKIFEPFVISRLFDAPRDRVWKAWTDAAQLKQWWGPQGFKVHTCKVDLRPGGTFRYGMTAPDGKDTWGRFVYRVIDAPERLVFIVSFSDPQGGVTRHPWSENWPLETLSTVIFEDQGAKTRVTVQWVPHDSATEIERKTFDEGRDSMKQGWGGTLNQFAAYLAKS